VPLLLAIIFLVLAGTLLILRPWSRDAAAPPAGPTIDFQANAVFLPGEFSPQEYLLLGGSQLAELHPQVMVDIIRAAAGNIRIRLLSGSAANKDLIISTLENHGLDPGTVDILDLPILTMWVRDFGPVTVLDAAGRRSMVDFHYRERRGNALDDSVPGYLARDMGFPLKKSPLLVEGGDFLGNGRGLCLMSTRVTNRNAHYLERDPQQTVREFAAVLGFEDITLAHPLQGETTGHVDMFCAFLQPDLVLVGSYDPEVDPENASLLDELAGRLQGMTTLEGPLRVARVPMPDHADDVWRTYTNVVFANDVLLVPVYPAYCPELDQQALDLYRRLLPGRQVVGIDASELIRMRGALRCITMNIPRGAP